MLEIGSFRGFKLYIYKEGVGNISNLCLMAKHRLGYSIRIDPENGTGNLIRFNNMLSDDIADKYRSAVRSLTKASHRLKAAQEEMNKPFPQEAEYQALLQEQAEINARLTVGEDKSVGGETEEKSVSKDSPSDGNLSQQPPSNRPKLRR